MDVCQLTYYYNLDYALRSDQAPRLWLKTFIGCHLGRGDGEETDRNEDVLEEFEEVEEGDERVADEQLVTAEKDLAAHVPVHRIVQQEVQADLDILVCVVHETENDTHDDEIKEYH